MNTVTERFVRQHREDDVQGLALMAARYPDVDMQLALRQIAGWQTARAKLPSWAAVEGLLYPSHLPMEQCSSEQTARYKARLAWRLNAEWLADVQQSVRQQGVAPEVATVSLVDLTGGFGVDFSFMAQEFEQCVYVERQPQLCDMARHNMPLLGLDRAEVVCADATDYLRAMSPATVVYLDPARRDAHGGRTVAISDCTPDLTAISGDLIAKSRYVIAKLSPMLDWHQAVETLNQQADRVREVHIVSVRNECKELLLVLGKPSGKPLTVYCVNDDETFVFHPDHHAEPSMKPQVFASLCPGQYLYEPHASIMKAGCFADVSSRYPVQKVAPNSHLFVSDLEIDGFPGRKFSITAISSLNKKAVGRTLTGVSQANITVRNFPMTVAGLRKRLALKDGGDIYLFATTNAAERHILLICKK